MKKIAVITGASSGMGRRFAETVDSFGRFDEVWVIARHQKALKELRDQVQNTLFEMYKDGTFDEIASKYADYNLPDMVCLGEYVK